MKKNDAVRQRRERARVNRRQKVPKKPTLAYDSDVEDELTNSCQGFIRRHHSCSQIIEVCWWLGINCWNSRLAVLYTRVVKHYILLQNMCGPGQPSAFVVKHFSLSVTTKIRFFERQDRHRMTLKYSCGWIKEWSRMTEYHIRRSRLNYVRNDVINYCRLIRKFTSKMTLFDNLAFRSLDFRNDIELKLFAWRQDPSRKDTQTAFSDKMHWMPSAMTHSRKTCTKSMKWQDRLL